MKIEDIKKIDVYFNDKHVGILSAESPTENAFIYTKEWLKNGFSISPFKLPLEEKVFICNDYLVNNMFGVFYDCLPDSWGNLLIDKYLVKNGYNPRNITLLQRLSLLDKNSLGGLVFKPQLNKNNIKSENIDFDILHNNIQKYLKDDESIDEEFLDLYHKGSSTGGSRPKINYLFNDGLYIIKFPSRQDKPSIGYEEYKLNELARKCGLNVPDHKLIKSKETKGYFATKRFDRINNKRIHVISLAGLFDLNPSLSQIHYKGFLQTVKVLCPEDLSEALKRMIFNYLIDNKDDHPRNFSFVYNEEEKKYRLSPFYDITSTPEIHEHMMQVNEKDNPTLDDFIKDASSVGIKKDRVIECYKQLIGLIKSDLKF